MICKECGSSLGKKFRFCPKCGSAKFTSNVSDAHEEEETQRQHTYNEKSSMDMISAVKSCLSKYATFQGRASRSELWWFALFQLLINLLALVVDLGIIRHEDGLTPIYGISCLLFTLPSLAVSVRRLHDIDKSGWYLLLYYIPIIGIIIGLVFNCTRGTNGKNRFGEDVLADFTVR